MFWMMALVCMLLSSCVRKPEFNAVDTFKHHYFMLPDPQPAMEVPQLADKRITLTATGVPLVDLLRQISDETGISVIAAVNLDNALVSLEIKDANAEQVLSAVARRLNERLAKIGSIYYLGTIAAEDRGFIVRRVHRLKSDELRNVVQLFNSEFGRNVAFSDGLLVAADRVEVLDRMSQALDKLETITSTTWVIQVYIISISNNFLHELGLDLTNTVKLSYRVNNGSNQGNVSGTLDALLVSTHDDVRGGIIAQPLLLVRDGGKAQISDGVEQPIPKYTNLTSGNLELSGFEIISVGLKVDASIREETRNSAQLDLTVELSKIAGYVESYPVVAKQRLQTEVSLRSGGEYLLGQLVDQKAINQNHGSVLPSIWKSEKSNSQTQVWARAYRIAGSPLLPPNQPLGGDTLLNDLQK